VLAAGLVPGHLLASASCAVRTISTATSVTTPNAAIRAKITNVELFSIGCKYFTIMIGDFKGNTVFIGFSYISLPLFGDSIVDYNG
jgi:hypothetical protein